jgi:soluble P-type ATPase
MLTIDIPGFGKAEIEHLVSDFTGTLSEDGRLCHGVRERLNKLSESVKIHILTADTFGRARQELKDINCTVHILEGSDHDILKEEYVRKLGPERVFALGNGNNDRRMLQVARIGVSVLLREGCATDAIMASDILAKSIEDGLDLLLQTKRLKATLRF